jgi:hypothetical protein
MKKIVLGVLLLLNLQIYGQAPKDISLTTKVFSSDFSSATSSVWPQVNNEFYFFLIKDNSYIIECNNNEKKAYLLPKGNPKLDTFKVEADIVPDREKDDDGVVGLAIDIQDKISGGYLVEINNNQQFRVVTIEGNGSYSPITNRGKRDGWVGYSAVKNGEYMHMTVTAIAGKIYLNIGGGDVFDFDNPITTRGQNGLFISGKYKSKVGSFEVYGPEKPGTVTDNTNTGDLTTLNNALLDCRKENKDLSSKLDISKQEVAEARYKNKELQTYISQNLDVKLQEELKKQTEIANNLKAENEKLKNESEDLRELKKTIEQNKDGDLVMVLSENLKKEQQKNAELEKKIKAMSGKKKGK